MEKNKITVLQQQADIQLRAAFVKKFGIHLGLPEFMAGGKEAKYSRHDGHMFSNAQVEFIHTFLDGWRSCAFTIEKLSKDETVRPFLIVKNVGC